MNYRKKKGTAGRTAGGCRKLGRNLLFRFLYRFRFAFATRHRLNPFHPSPRHPLPISLGPVFSQPLALVSLCSPFPSHRNDKYPIIRSRSTPKDSTLPVDSLPHPIRLQCLPIPIPLHLLRRWHLGVSRTGTLIDIVLLPYSAWPLNKMWRSRMTWPEVRICSTLLLPSMAVLNVIVSAKAFARSQSSYLNAVQEELRLGARCTLPRSENSSAYPESYGA